MHPRIWGHDMWRSIHYVALGYPVREPTQDVKVSYETYFRVLGSVLPCVKCSQHYDEHFESHPVGPALVGRAELFRWTVDLHNAVSKSLGRETWTYERAYQVYVDRKSSYATRTYTAPTILSLTLCFLLIAAVFFWIRRRKRSGLTRTRAS